MTSRRHVSAGASCNGGADQGLTLIEAVIALAVIAVVAGVSAPVTASAIDASRARQAASFMATRFRLARTQAVNSSTNVGVVFDFAGGAWTFRLCSDGTNNGIRRADILAGVDPCIGEPYRMTELFPGVDVAVDPALRGPNGEPPNPDAVRFGKADLISFSPAGSCTAGSLYLRSRGQVQYAIRVSGITGRTRVLRYDSGSRTWKDP